VSAAAAPARAAARPASRPATRPGAARRTPPPPALHVVAAPPWRAPLAPFILLSVAVVVAGLLGLLLLNTLVAQDSFRLHAIEQDSTALREREQTLISELARMKAPGELADRAQKLGLVEGNTPGFLRLHDGSVVGDPKAAQLPLPPAPPTSTVAPPVTTVAPPVTGTLAKPDAPAERAATTKPPAKNHPTARTNKAAPNIKTTAPNIKTTAPKTEQTPPTTKQPAPKTKQTAPMKKAATRP
jgi:hypothetical protein